MGYYLQLPVLVRVPSIAVIVELIVLPSLAAREKLADTWINNISWPPGSISQEMYRKINAKSTTYSKTEEGKQALMGFCETWAQQYVTAMSNDIFVANEAYYYNMSSPTVNILTVQPSDVMPNAAEENSASSYHFWNSFHPILLRRDISISKFGNCHKVRNYGEQCIRE